MNFTINLWEYQIVDAGLLPTSALSSLQIEFTTSRQAHQTKPLNIPQKLCKSSKSRTEMILFLCFSESKKMYEILRQCLETTNTDQLIGSSKETLVNLY